MRKAISRASLWLAVVVGTRVAAACPLCADNLSNDVYGKNPTQLGRGFFWSIIFMIALPFLTVGFVAARILIAKRRQRGSGDSPAAFSEAETAPSVSPTLSVSVSPTLSEASS